MNAVDAAGDNIGCAQLLRRLSTLREDLSPRPDHLYGWLPGGVFGGNGCAWVGASLVSYEHAAFGNDTDGSAATSRYRRTLAHELEHNYGLRHAECDIGIGGRGFDVANRVVKSDTLLEVMCAGRLEREAWADLDIYWRKYQNWGYYSSPISAADLQPGDAGPQADTDLLVPAPYVIVSGYIMKTEQGIAGELGPLHRVTRNQAIKPPDGQSYCLEFQSAGGALLQKVCFELPLEGDGPDEERSMMPYAYTLAWPEGTARVQLMFGAQLLDEQAASAHPPVVKVISPNGGESWSGARTVTWSASDLDGDALDFTVLYSRDGGATWMPLTNGLAATSFALDSGALAGGSQCLVKVRASDGFYTAEDDSDAFFTIPLRSPRATISLPAEGAVYTATDEPTLIGQGYDPEDGLLPESALTWYDGTTLLGHGRLLGVGPLSLGTHTITLRVRDSDGSVAEESRRMIVGFPTWLPLTLHGG